LDAGVPHRPTEADMYGNLGRRGITRPRRSRGRFLFWQATHPVNFEPLTSEPPKDHGGWHRLSSFITHVRHGDAALWLARFNGTSIRKIARVLVLSLSFYFWKSSSKAPSIAVVKNRLYPSAISERLFPRYYPLFYAGKRTGITERIGDTT